MAEFLAIFSIVTGSFTVVALSLQFIDWKHGRGVVASVDIPIRIRRSLSHEAYSHGIERLIERLAHDSFEPDIILAVNYGGLSPAAEIALHLRIPVIFVEVKLTEEKDKLYAERVLMPPELTEPTNRAALIVDNSIRSGKTLALVRSTVSPQLGSIRLCVIYRPSPDSGNFITPDYYVFKSSRPIELLK